MAGFNPGQSPPPVRTPTRLAIPCSPFALVAADANRRPAMYRTKLWTMRLFAGFGAVEETNARFRELLRAGGDGLSVAFALPTLMGCDSDAPLAAGEVGRCGVAVDTLADMEELFAGIDLGRVTTSLTINGPAAILLAMYVAAADAAGTDRHR